MKGFMAFVDRLFNRHKLVRRGLLLWAVWIITYSIQSYFQVVAFTDGSVATVMTAIIGILGVVIGLYQWSRMRDPIDDD